MLCFSHRQLYSIFPHKDSCLGTRSNGEKGSKEAALKNVVPRSSCLSIKGSAASAFLVGGQFIHPTAARTCGFQQNSLQMSLSGLRVQPDNSSGESLKLVQQTCKQVETDPL